MTERTQILLLQILGTLVIALIIIGVAVLAVDGFPIPATLLGVLASGLSALFGKLFGQPLPQVTLNHVSKLPPPMAAEAARRAIMSLPPDQVGGWEPNMRLEQAAVVLQGISSYPPPPPEPKQ